MKALTIRQPWASLVIAGIKDVENRTWATKHRGRLAIHAGVTPDREGLRRHGHLLPAGLPYGAVVGTVGLVDCNQRSRSEWAEPDHWHWILESPHRLRRPIRMRGRL